MVLSLLISLSFSGGLMILLIFFVCKLFQKKIGWRWQYYIWIVVIARLLLPFSPGQNLAGSLGEKLCSLGQDYETDLGKNAGSSLGEDGISLLEKEEKTEALKNEGKEGEMKAELKNKILQAVSETGKYICIFWM